MSARGRIENAKFWVERWVSVYTRGLPADVASARVDEIRSDLHEQTATQSAQATLPGELVDRVIWSRSIRGVIADLAWRDTEMRRFRTLRATTMTLRERRSTRRLSWLLYTAAALIAATGVIASIRAVTNTSIYAQPGAGVPTFVTSMFALLSLGLLLNTATRARGVVLLAVSSWLMNWYLVAGSSNLSVNFGVFLMRASRLVSIPVVLIAVCALPALLITTSLVVVLSRLHRIEQRPAS